MAGPYYWFPLPVWWPNETIYFQLYITTPGVDLNKSGVLSVSHVWSGPGPWSCVYITVSMYAGAGYDVRIRYGVNPAALIFSSDCFFSPG